MEVIAIVAAALIGAVISGVATYAVVKRRKKRLPICEVRKAPSVLYVPEKKTIDEAGKGKTEGLLEKQTASVPEPRRETPLEGRTRVCFFGVLDSNRDLQQSPQLQRSDAGKERNAEGQKSAAERCVNETAWSRTLMLSAFCCAGIGLLHIYRQRNNRKIREGTASAES